MGVFEIETPNGTFEVEAPDQAAALEAVGQFQPKQAPQDQEARWDHKVGAVIDGVAQGMTFGFSDEIAAGMASGGGLWGDYDEELAAERARMAENKELAGGYELGGQIAGGLATGAGLMKSGVTMLAKNPTVLKAAGEGALYGGAYGAGSSEEGERLEGAGKGAVMGFAGGAALQGGANAVKSKIANKAAQKAAPTVEAMKVKANDLYGKMRKSGFKFRESKVNHLKGNITLVLGETTDGLAPKAHELKKMIERDLVGDVDIQDMHNLSKAVNRISRSKLEGDDKYYVGRIKDMVDAAFDETKATDYKGPLSALPMKKQADQLWKTQRKTELIEHAMEQAQDAASGFENGIVIEFRKIKRNKKLFNQFDNAEKQMINGVIRRMSPQQILRAGRYLSPTSPLGLILFGGTNLAGSPLLAAGIGGVGMAAKKANQMLTKAKADAVHQAVATQSAPIQSVSKSARRTIAPLAQQLESQMRAANDQTAPRSIPQLKRPQR